MTVALIEYAALSSQKAQLRVELVPLAEIIRSRFIRTEMEHLHGGVI